MPISNGMTSLRHRARLLKSLVYALWFAYRDPRTPLSARITAACVIGYALSPIDLIPDPIPILGYLDDLVLLPLGIALAIRLMPATIWADAREQATTAIRDGATLGRIAAVIIVGLWIALAVIGFFLMRRWI